MDIRIMSTVSRNVPSMLLSSTSAQHMNFSRIFFSSIEQISVANWTKNLFARRLLAKTRIASMKSKYRAAPSDSTTDTALEIVAAKPPRGARSPRNIQAFPRGRHVRAANSCSERRANSPL